MCIWLLYTEHLFTNNLKSNIFIHAVRYTSFQAWKEIPKTFGRTVLIQSNLHLDYLYNMKFLDVFPRNKTWDKDCRNIKITRSERTVKPTILGDMKKLSNYSCKGSEDLGNSLELLFHGLRTHHPNSSPGEQEFPGPAYVMWTKWIWVTQRQHPNKYVVAGCLS